MNKLFNGLWGNGVLGSADVHEAEFWILNAPKAISRVYPIDTQWRIHIWVLALAATKSNSVDKGRRVDDAFLKKVT